ncbi:MAG TPA: hypothetical protein VLZ12_04020 [Verrucomicrobiae bacterium]|nr:hypothetical protein [Verrucomicrobiae bacterium]
MVCAHSVQSAELTPATIALTADKTVWTCGTNSYGELGRTGDYTVPRQVPPSVLSNVVAIAGGNQFSLAVTGDGRVYGWGNNSAGQLGTNSSAIAFTNSPMRVPGISSAVLVSAPNPASCDVDYPCTNGKHSMAMTVDGGTNRYWGWGENAYGQVGNGVFTNQYTPAQVQFCTRCQRCVQLGTGGSFTAQCNGTLYLYFNDDQTAFGDNGTNSYSVTFHAAGQTNLLAIVMGANSSGVAISTVTNSGVYFYSASGFCARDIGNNMTDPDGRDPSSNQVACSSINITNSICPMWRCFSLVGKIQ